MSCLLCAARQINRRYYTHEQYLQYRGLISSEQGIVIVYARVSSPSQKKDLALQKQALRAYCLAHGIKVDQWVEDIGSALNYKRKGFNQVIEQIELGHVKQLVIGYQDRLCALATIGLKHSASDMELRFW